MGTKSQRPTQRDDQSKGTNSQRLEVENKLQPRPMGTKSQRPTQRADQPKGTKSQRPEGQQGEGGIGAKHWRRLQPGLDNPRDVAAARLTLAEEIMGEDATKKLKVRGLVFPRWRAARHPAAPMLREYAT